MGHPELRGPYVDRYCHEFSIANYHGDPEPTRQRKNGETEDCVTFVFVPQKNARGSICIADDYCSTRMSYVCEMSKRSWFFTLYRIDSQWSPFS